MYRIIFRFRTEKITNPKKRLYVRLKVNGITASDFATPILLEVEKWNQRHQILKGNTTLDFANRAMLMQIESDIVDLIRANPSKSASQIRAMYLNKELPPATILKTYKKYIVEKKECWSGTKFELAENTIQRWYNCMRHVSEFLNDKDIELTDIDVDFSHRFYLYLIKKNQRKDKKKKLGHDYAVRCLTYLNQVLEFARRKRLINFNTLDITDYKRNKPKDVEYLDSETLLKLENKRFDGILEDTRIVFLAMCYSGLNHCDLHNLEKLKESKSITFKVDRGKNEKREVDKAIVPVLPKLRLLLEAFNYKLPNHEIHVINRHLHVFESVLGVSINITTYTARKTAGMWLCENGVSIEVISKILGHSSIATTQRYYVKVLEKRVIKDTLHLIN